MHLIGQHVLSITSRQSGFSLCLGAMRAACRHSLSCLVGTKLGGMHLNEDGSRDGTDGEDDETYLLSV